MEDHHSVLVLDDGELDGIYEMLVELEADVVRLQGAEIGSSVLAPRDVLISAGRRTLTNMPELVAAQDAQSAFMWVCVHNQDFLPMRERLSEMGVHFLLQNAVDEEARRRFLIQLLQPGADQRESLRLPMGTEFRYRTNRSRGDTEKGKIVDLSVEGCRILTRQSFESGNSLVLLLPASLGGGDELELAGTVLRDSEPEFRSGQDLFSTVLRFEALDDAEREHLESISRGERLGTQLTPLAPPPYPLEGSAANRRGEDRYSYDRRMQVFGPRPDAAGSVFGRDLSLSGVRLAGCNVLEPGMQVTVALFGAAREEPIVLEACVIRTTPDGEAALTFSSMAPPQREALEKLLRTRPVLDALEQPDSDAGRTIVAELRPAEFA